MGFIRPERATNADFLTSLTNPEQRIIRSGYENTVPYLLEEFANIWKNSSEAKNLRLRLDEFDSAHPVVDQASSPDTEAAPELDRVKYARMHSLNGYMYHKADLDTIRSSRNTFTLSIFQQTTACFGRAWLRLRKTIVPEVSSMVANLIQGVIIGSVFYNLNETSDSFQRRLSCYFLLSSSTHLCPHLR
jgi:ATP-binding cassette, subfamily G (WHITE), member 2, PDR